MAQLPNQQGFPLNYQPVVMVQQQVPQNVGNLKGSGPRRAMGSLIIACGCAQIVFSICLVIVLRPYGLLYGHWGIWNGVLAIIIGSFGLASARKKSMVITFMVLAINATLLCVLCCGYQATHAAYFRYYDVGAFVLFTISCLLYGLQLLFCIIGASFTCVALSDGVPQQQLITYPPHAMPPGQAYGASPYTGVVNMAMQPAPVNVGSVNDDPPAYQFAVAQPKI
ncbi:uncharacterized protein [Apostichopus japonicus]|uniref:uncharacterized protein isoform X1 n=1 Tax=Stichopus japonicus TaxID=307972 RepID=UPI003AB58DE1